MEYVIIGNSAAAIGAVEGIRSVDKKGTITLVSNEPYHTYSRPLISYLLQEKVTEDAMKYRPDTFYTENACRLIFASAVQIDAKKKRVLLDNGQELPYGKLLTATGSSASVVPFAGLQSVKNAFTFMGLDDAKALRAALKPDCRVLIVGAGLIGLKCAEGIVKLAGSVTVVEVADRILSAVLDGEGAKKVQAHIESKGVSFMLSAKIERFEETRAFLSDGRQIEFDVLVTATGVKPNVDLLKGIARINKGILINEKSQTSATDIYAAGDCTECVDVSSGESKIMALLPNAYMQGECAGLNMAGVDTAFTQAIPMNAAGFFGLHIISAGTYCGEVYTCAEKDYKKLFYSRDKLNGYILIGNVEKAGIYTSLIRGATPLSSIDFNLVCRHPSLMAFTKTERAAKLGGEK
ncbi:MAG: FAD-dependent oxidoreductase [Firmicutes bacterium]|nr:FAD-dependent oxidoreductase [Bacillota bacterium]